MNKKNLIRLTSLFAAGIVLALAFIAINGTAKGRTCATDNRQVQATLSTYKPGDVTALSKALSQMSKDGCKEAK